MNLNLATTTCTAFASYTALVLACCGGYVFSAREASTDELPIRRAKQVLARALKASGYEVAA